jgi:hypothetical protein
MQLGRSEMALPTIEDAAHVLRMEYLEMPGLALTAWQAQRLCNLSSELWLRNDRWRSAWPRLQ